jgi:hypothetical protein
MSSQESVVRLQETLSVEKQNLGAERENGNSKPAAQKPASPIQRSFIGRRSFIGKTGGMAAMAMAAAVFPKRMGASVITYKDTNRTNLAFAYRKQEAQAEKIDIGVLPDNGDATKFTDHSGSWSKALAHDNLEIVNQNSWNSFTKALTSGNFSDFEAIIVGNPGGTNGNAQLNGPQTALAYDLEGLDSHATKIPPAPSISSAESADEEVEHYWAALLRDVNFSDYGTNPTAAQAVSEMNKLSYISGSGNTEYPFPLTPNNLFRGQIVQGDGNVQGPYLSQFLVQPTFFGAQPITQMYQTFLPGQNFMTSVAEFMNVQNGFAPSGSLAFDNTFRHIRNGRDLAAYTHVDVLHEAYFIALLILLGIRAPRNPGNPYIGSGTEHGFGTLDGADAAATLPEMATRALKAAWFHKWIINLRQRPEEMGALVHAQITNRSPKPQAAGSLNADVLNSAAVAQVFSQFGTYLLPQAFPEGAPTHPCYPTGHGTVGGACLTALKFFFDGSQPIRPLLQAAGTDVMQPSADGLTLVPYTGSDRDSLTINGEMSKLAFNISFGHGIHAGIHFRSSTQQSILLGEQVAIAVLKDRSLGYNEPFNISITKFDGTTQTFSNAGMGSFDTTTTTPAGCAV